ncbi:MAG: hypothetical protein NVSMB10_14440 [Steroidobacteraceae bacterium]
MRTAVAGLLIAVLSSGATLLVLSAAQGYRSTGDMLAPARPSPLLGNPAETGIAGLQEVAFDTTAGARTAGWYAPSHNHAAIVVTHGTNDDRSSMLPEIRLLSAAGFGVLAFDWPGLGRSGGRIRWDADAGRALTAAIDWLSHRTDVDPEKIGGLGFSIGGVMMLRVAAIDPRLRALVLEGTPADYDGYIAQHAGRWGVVREWPARWALRDSNLLERNLAPEHVIGALAKRPVLLIGGTADTEVPEALVRRLFAAAHEPKSLWIVPQAEHGHYAQVAPLEYSRRLRSFFSSGLAAHGADID